MKIGQIFLFIIFLGSLCFSADETNTTAEPMAAEQALVVSYAKTPSLLYQNEIFEIQLKALVGSNQIGTLKSELFNYSGIKLLNSNYKWTASDDGSFTLKLFFKTIDSSVKLPDIKTTLSIDNIDKESLLLEGELLEALTINQTPKFCGVIASSLRVTNYKIDGYDTSNNILAIDVSAKYANLEDFKIQGVSMQGVNSIKNGYENGKMIYYLIIPNTQKTLEFEYFDKNKNDMQNVLVTLDLSKIEKTVSTQTDLQPKSSDKALYVFLTVAIIAVILYGIYYFRREKIFLFLIIATVVVGVLFLFIPNEQVKIKKGAIVYLLPTENSTPFFKAAVDTPVEKLKESEGYIKIKMEDGKIGWVKGDSVVGN